MFVTRPEHQKECAQLYIAKLYGLVVVFKRSVNPMGIAIKSHKRTSRRGHGIKNMMQTSCACLEKIELGDKFHDLHLFANSPLHLKQSSDQ